MTEASCADRGTLDTGSMNEIDADRFVLQEFRLAEGASHDDAARILASTDEAAVPLLTSISDDRDVAFVRCVPSDTPADEDPIDHTMLQGLVSRWQDHRTYRPSVAESSLRPPSAYSLAVTESGLNGGERSLRDEPGRPGDSGTPPSDRIALLWIGTPVDSFAGLFVLVGRDEERAEAQDPDWPLPLSEDLGVRIYRG